MPDLTFTDGDDQYQTVEPGTYNLAFLGGNDRLQINSVGQVTADMGSGDDDVSYYYFPQADPNMAPGPATITGGSGNDHFFIGWNNFSGDAGDGNDLIDIDYGDNISVATGTGDDIIAVFGPVTNLTLSAGEGNDVLHGRGVGGYVGSFVNASISADAGNDRLYDFQGAGSGSVELLGGAGNDAYRLNPATAPVVVEFAGEGIDTIRIPVGTSYTLPDNVENLRAVVIPGSTSDAGTLTGNSSNNVLIGGDTDDQITGLAGNDWLYGHGGTDVLNGDAGKDHLDGGAGDDTLFGGDGADTLIGGGGNDTIVGGLGADTMTGGLGTDVFRYESVADSTYYSADAITDFDTDPNTAVHDVIDLSAIDANPLLPGNQAFTLVYPDDNFSGAGGLYVVFETGGMELLGDTDGDHNWDLRIIVPGGFGSNDIIL